MGLTHKYKQIYVSIQIITIKIYNDSTHATIRQYLQTNVFKNVSIIHRLMLLPERVHCEAAVMLSMHLELRENTCMGSNLRLQLCCSACWSSLFRLWEHKRRSRMWSNRLSKQTSPRGPDTWQPAMKNERNFKHYRTQQVTFTTTVFIVSLFRWLVTHQAIETLHKLASQTAFSVRYCCCMIMMWLHATL